MLKPRTPRIVLTLIGAFVVILVVAWLSGSTAEICDKSQAGQKECTAYNLAPFILIQIREFLHSIENIITALATIAIAWFTWTLYQSSEKMWRVNRQTTFAAIHSAQAAKKAVEYAPRVERAYLFLSLDVKSRIEIWQPHVDDTRSYIEFGFKNHGKTPAVVEELHVTAMFWAESWPAMEIAEKLVIQRGWVISAGETQGEYKTEFSLHDSAVERARKREGYILFWGKVVYRDVFKEVHESGWCRAFDFKSEGWRFAGDETLNYYT